VAHTSLPRQRGEQKGDRAKRVLAGLAASALGSVIAFAKRGLLVPLFLWAWGPSHYGEWLAMSAGVATLSLLDLGMHNYVLNRLRQCYSIGAEDDFLRLLHSGLRLGLLALAAGLPVLAAIVCLAPVETWLGLSTVSHPAAAVTMLLLGVYVLSKIPTGLVSGAYRSIGEYGRGGMVSNVILTGQVLTIAILLLLRQDFWAVAAAEVAVVWLGSAFAVYDIERRKPWISFGLRQGTWRLVASMILPGSLFLMISLSQACAAQGTVIVVSIFHGGAVVSLFVTTRVLAYSIGSLTGMVRNAVWPELTALQAEDEAQRTKDVHIRLVKLCLMLTATGAVILCFAGGDVYRVWTQKQLDFDPVLLGILVGNAVTTSVWGASSVVALSANRHSFVAARCAAAGALIIALCILLVPAYGPRAAALAMWIGDVSLCAVSIPNAVCRILGERPAHFWVEAVLRGIPCVAATVGAAWGISLLVSSPAPKVLLVAFGAASVMAATSLSMWFDARDRKWMTATARTLWPRRCA